MDKTGRYIKIFSKLTALWLFIAIWWGFSLFSPFQPHNNIITTDLPLLLIAFIAFIIIGFYTKQENKASKINISLIFPFLLFIILALICIFYFKDVTLSFILLTLAAFIFSYIIDLYPLKESSWTLLLASIGLAITRGFMNSVRGRPDICSNFFCAQASYLINIFGGRSSYVSGTLVFNGKKITCDLIKLGFYPWLALTLGFCILIITSTAKPKKRIITLTVAFILHYLYLLLRFAYYSLFIPNMIAPGTETFNLFYWRRTLLSFAPLIPLWYVIILQAGLIKFPLLPGLPMPYIRKKQTIVGIILLLSAAFFTIYLLFPGFTNSRDIHIVIDEIHSEWESSLVDFDEEITGTLAENSYHSFLDYLRHFHKVSVLTDKSTASLPEGVNIINADTLTPQLLDETQTSFSESKTVLILKCITTPFTENEIETIKDFVFKGGCVFLVGDHTDVFFMNKNINELSKHFGIRYKQNSVYFVDSGWIITEPRDYRIHPVTSYMDKFIWATGDTLEVSSPAYPLIYSPLVCYADHVGYFFESFIGNTVIDAEETLGSFCVLAGTEYGKGKAIAFTDSTCFNNKLMFTVGRRELIAGINGWFGIKRLINPFPWVTLLLIICFLFFVVKNRLDRGSLLYLVIIFIPLGCILGIMLTNRLNKYVYNPPEPIVQLPPKILIDSAHNPEYCLGFGDCYSFISPESYADLTSNIGRIDLFPEIIYKDKITENILDEKGCLIISSPTKAYTKGEKEDVLDYVTNGGSLLLIEGPNPDSTINQIANLFDINLRLDPYRNKVSQMNKQLTTHKKNNDCKINPVWVDGGEILFSFQEMPIIAFSKKGKGLLVIIGDDTIFQNNNPSSFLVKFQCGLIKALVNKDIESLKSIDWNYLEWE